MHHLHIILYHFKDWNKKILIPQYTIHNRYPHESWKQHEHLK